MVNYMYYIVLLAILIQCSFSAEESNTTKSASVIPEISEDVTGAIQKGIFSLTLNLNKLLQENNATKNRNILFSPTNIYIALGLVHLATEGNSRDEISDVMGVSKTYKEEQISQSIQFLISTSQNVRNIVTIKTGKAVLVKVTSINFANGIFVQKGLPLKSNFTSDINTYYNSSVNDVDFVNNAVEATKIINEYVANKTENNIPTLFPEPLTSDIRILFVTSLYFKSIWDSKFEPSATKPDVFFLNNNQNTTVQMMHKTFETPFVSIPSKLTAIKLWFADKEASLFAVLPHENQTLNDLSSTLTTDDIHQIIDGANNSYVNIKLPKVSFKWSKKLNDELVALGAKKLFIKTNLENMVDDKNLKVDEVNHATSIKITEDGTEASAVTTVSIGLRSAAGHKKRDTFHANRPFFIFIYHHAMKSILFFGSVYNPNDN